jgi:DNA-binding NtrC family response regulator
VIETRAAARVGSLKTRAIDVRFVAATNRNLEADIAAGRFRRDLYYRLNGISLHIPPLRERRSEILPLVAFVPGAVRDASGDRPAPTVARRRATCWRLPWQGNVREVRNVVERALLLCEGRRSCPSTFRSRAWPPTRSRSRCRRRVARSPARRQREPAAPRSARPTDRPAGVVDEEKDRSCACWPSIAGNQTQAAKALGIARSTLIARLESYGVPAPAQAGRTTERDSPRSDKLSDRPTTRGKRLVGRAFARPRETGRQRTARALLNGCHERGAERLLRRQDARQPRGGDLDDPIHRHDH